MVKEALLCAIGCSLGAVFLFGGARLLYMLSKGAWRRKNRKGEETYKKVLEFSEGYYIFSSSGILLFILEIFLILMDVDDFLETFKRGDMPSGMYILPIAGVISLFLVYYYHYQKTFYSDYSLKISRIFHKTRVIHWSEVLRIKVAYYKRWTEDSLRCKITLFTQNGHFTINILDLDSGEFKDFNKTYMRLAEKYDIEVIYDMDYNIVRKIRVKKILKFMGPVFLIGLLAIIYFLERGEETKEGFWNFCTTMIFYAFVCIGIFLVGLRNRKKDTKTLQNLSGQYEREESLLVCRAPARERGFMVGILLLLWFIVIGAGFIPAAMGDWENGKEAAMTFEMLGIPCMIIYTVVMINVSSSLWTDIYFNREKIMIKRWWRKRTIFWYEIGETRGVQRKSVFFDRHGKKLFSLSQNFEGYGAFRLMYEELLPHHSEKPIPKEEPFK